MTIVSEFDSRWVLLTTGLVSQLIHFTWCNGEWARSADHYLWWILLKWCYLYFLQLSKSNFILKVEQIKIFWCMLKSTINKIFPNSFQTIKFFEQIKIFWCMLKSTINKIFPNSFQTIKFLEQIKIFWCMLKSTINKIFPNSFQTIKFFEQIKIFWCMLKSTINKIFPNSFQTIKFLEIFDIINMTFQPWVFAEVVGAKQADLLPLLYSKSILYYGVILYASKYGKS